MNYRNMSIACSLAFVLSTAAVVVGRAQSGPPLYPLAPGESVRVTCEQTELTVGAPVTQGVDISCAALPPPPPPPPPTNAYPNFTGRYVNAPMQGTPIPPLSSESAPTCPSALHSATAWHPLWMPGELLTSELVSKLQAASVPAATITQIGQVGCHYTHTHHANPELADNVFGPAGALWGGQTISYPWATMSASGAHENHAKHEGSKYMVERSLPTAAGNTTDLNWQIGPHNRVTDARIQYHAMGGPLDATVRFHSYYTEYRVCHKTQTTQCGTTQFGGHADYGVLHVPYKQQFLALPGQDPVPMTQSLNDDPYRAHALLEDGEWMKLFPAWLCKGCGKTSFTIGWLWTTSARYGWHQVGGQFIASHDDWQGIDRANPSRVQLVCAPQVNPCRLNNTEHQPFTLWAHAPPSFDQSAQDTDPSVGFVSYQGYTSVKGVLAPTCTTASADCVPLKWVHMPTGYAGWNTSVDGGRDLARWRDFDVSPGSVWWVQYPN